MCILLNVKKHEKTFALNVDIFKGCVTVKKDFPYGDHCAIIIQIDGKSKKTDKGEILMKHVKTLNTRKLQNTIKTGGCGECQTSCQSACKTSCTVGNQTCEKCK